ncbi:MAG: hypothetical protein QOJ44_1833 [Acidimicrobiaceae bacterium]|nr:hypothetical protein [Acidimicrobiaceae bacterium]
MTKAPPARGSRIDWSQLPADFRDQIAEVCGDPVVYAATQTGGFSPGVASRIECRNGKRYFVKAVSADTNLESVKLHRREAEIMASLDQSIDSGLRVPRILGIVEHARWFALVIEDLPGNQPVVPWIDRELQLVVSALDQLSSQLTPAPDVTVDAISTRLGAEFSGWRTLAHGGSFLQLDPWSLRHLEEMAALESNWVDAAEGVTLLHADLRADNLLIVNEEVFVVDWPHACIGAAFVDMVFFAPSVAMQGGPDPMALLSMSRWAKSIHTSQLIPVVCAFAGYLTEHSLRSAPPGLPTLRPFQAAQAEIARRWLADLVA